VPDAFVVRIPNGGLVRLIRSDTRVTVTQVDRGIGRVRERRYFHPVVNGRPAGKVREVFERVSKLPCRQQEHIVNWVSAYVSHYEQNRQS